MTKHTTPSAHQDDTPLALDETTTTEPSDFLDLTHEELAAKLVETQTALHEATSALDDTKHQLLRNHAELDNIRKRASKDVQNAHKYGVEQLAVALLPVIDSLERAMSLEIGDNELAKQIHAGLEMTLKLLLDTLGKSSVQPIDPLGTTFDPALHQAISMQEDANAESNTVLQVLQKGYQLHDRLIRPALVIVAK